MQMQDRERTFQRRGAAILTDKRALDLISIGAFLEVFDEYENGSLQKVIGDIASSFVPD